MFSNHSADMPIGHIPDLVAQAIDKTFTAQNALSSFRLSKNFPFDKDIVKAPDIDCENANDTNEAENLLPNI